MNAQGVIVTLALLGAPFVVLWGVLELDAWRWRRHRERRRRARGGYVDRREDYRR